ncbi:MAG: hypothetical protein DWQ38_12585 [Acidobacteria bacterium]|nr:MAG: hypothetical protein DWQ38_12585 [Acidobacteriota bacterium]
MISHRNEEKAADGPIFKTLRQQIGLSPRWQTRMISPKEIHEQSEYGIDIGIKVVKQEKTLEALLIRVVT